jgi:hypothetical protein
MDIIKFITNLKAKHPTLHLTVVTGQLLGISKLARTMPSATRYVMRIKHKAGQDIVVLRDSKSHQLKDYALSHVVVSRAVSRAIDSGYTHFIFDLTSRSNHDWDDLSALGGHLDAGDNWFSTYDIPGCACTIPTYLWNEIVPRGKFETCESFGIDQLNFTFNQAIRKARRAATNPVRAAQWLNLSRLISLVSRD